MGTYRHDQDEARYACQDTRPPVTFPPVVEHGLVDDYLLSRGLCPVTAKVNGWYPTVLHDGVPRVVIPAVCYRDFRWVYWQARAVVDDAVKRYESPHTSRKDAVIMVVPPTSKWAPEWVLCEGPMDALACAKLGWPAIALMGTHPPVAVWTHVACVAFAQWGPMVILVDRDENGEGVRAAFRWATELLQAHNVLPTRVVVPPAPYKDLAAMPPHLREAVLR